MGGHWQSGTAHRGLQFELPDSCRSEYSGLVPATVDRNRRPRGGVQRIVQVAAGAAGRDRQGRILHSPAPPADRGQCSFNLLLSRKILSVKLFLNGGSFGRGNLRHCDPQWRSRRFQVYSGSVPKP